MTTHDLERAGFVLIDGNYVKPPKKWKAKNEFNNHERSRPECPVIQEQQNADTRAIDYKPKKTAADGVDHPKFRATITLLYSDRRRRDIDGAASTLLDCLVAAFRRLAPVDTGTKRKGR